MNNKILGEKRKSNFDENLADVVNKMYDNMPEVTPEPATAQNVKGNFCLEKVCDGFIFHSLPCVGSVKLLNNYLDCGSPRSHGNWRVYCGHSNGLVVPNSIISYQMARALYELRNDTDSKSVVYECLALFTQDWTSRHPHTGTKVEYGSGLDASIEHLQLDGSFKTNNFEVPEFTKHNKDWSYLVLASEQPEYSLGITIRIPDNAKPMLQALLGEGYEQAGVVFQYVSPRKNGNLREIRLWTPTLTNRNAEWAVVFGVSINSYFSIGAGGGISNGRPARGVVAVRENSGVITI